MVNIYWMCPACQARASYSGSPLPILLPHCYWPPTPVESLSCLWYSLTSLWWLSLLFVFPVFSVEIPWVSSNELDLQNLTHFQFSYLTYVLLPQSLRFMSPCFLNGELTSLKNENMKVVNRASSLLWVTLSVTFR